MPISVEAGNGLNAMLKEYSSISSALHNAQKTHTSLLKQMSALDTQGEKLTQQQEILNQRVLAHNKAVATQQKQIAKNKSNCNNSDVSKNTAMHVNSCDKHINKINQKTLEINAGKMPLKIQQSQLDKAFAQYNQATKNWTVQEDHNTATLNSLNRGLNNWLNRASALLSSQAFRAEVFYTHAEKVCNPHTLPNGQLSTGDLQRDAAGADRCLRYVTLRLEQASSHKTQ